MECLYTAVRRRCFAALVLILLLWLAGTALADNPHTILLKCGGDGFVGTDRKGSQQSVRLELPPETLTEDGDAWTLDGLAKRYDRPLAVECGPLQNFYSAEEYHQKYLEKHPDGYCHISPGKRDRLRRYPFRTH